MKIREETGTDAPGIAALTRAAFGGEYEVSLIEKLRAARLVIVSLVAVQEGAVVAPFGGKAFMGLELVHGSLSGRRGSVSYPEEFGV